MQAPKNVFLHPFFVGLPLFYSLSLATQIQLEDMKAPPQALGRRGVGGEVGGKEGGGAGERVGRESYAVRRDSREAPSQSTLPFWGCGEAEGGG